METQECPPWSVIVGHLVSKSKYQGTSSVFEILCTAGFDSSLEKRVLKLSSEAVVVFLVVFIS